LLTGTITEYFSGTKEEENQAGMAKYPHDQSSKLKMTQTFFN
jgi:hypothetical protein